METLSVGRLALVFFFCAFAIFPKHQCHEDYHGELGSMKTTKMIEWDDERGEKLDLDFCVKSKCKEFSSCWCCRLPTRKDCYGDEATCEANCPPLPQSSPST